ncbi:hypothetical protein TRP8649_01220 [Pelagimonas phthalicica]|uniref:Uncharacterized protein n=1 Tax=Pelagimonas phthalicica TaxID=1037362 RepID=A0A238J8X9_9RHOB|nr:hypothetical protein [Pelagimonas phthalicica]TDS94355.1 hypothetical protein CLV87_0852 [Pelagimonas phthalicica]SMX27118.1 hypothetical protein TRP8649_01220 [Pelagimonas phthalicica]
MWARLAYVLRAATGRGGARSARPRGRSVAARRCRRAGHFTVALVSLLIVPFKVVDAQSTSPHPYSDVLTYCASPSADFENAVAGLNDAGWTSIPQGRSDEIAKIIGDGNIQSYKIATSAEQLKRHRTTARLMLAKYVKTKNSTYFQSSTFASPDNNSTFVNLYYQVKADRLFCRAASTRTDIPSDLNVDKHLYMNGLRRIDTNDEILVVSKKTNSIGSSSRLVELNAGELNKHLNEALLATSSLTVVRKRQ